MTSRFLSGDKTTPPDLEIAGAGPAAWQNFTDKSPKAFYDAMTEGLPQGTKLSIDLNADGGLNGLEYSYESANGQSFGFTRGFNGTKAYHTSATVDGMAQQGVNKIVGQKLLSLYEEKGITEIEGDFTRVGVYVGAKSGAVPTQTSWDKLRRNMLDRLDFLESRPVAGSLPLPVSVTDRLRESLNDPDPKNIRAIVDEPHKHAGMTMGKLLMLPQDNLPAPVQQALTEERVRWPRLGWKGKIDMNDAESANRYKSYLTPKAAAPAPPRAKPPPPPVRG